MRVKAEAILEFGWDDDRADNRTVRDYRFSINVDGYYRQGDLMNLSATAVPEPSTLVSLFGLCMAGLLVWVRRQRSSVR